MTAGSLTPESSWPVTALAAGHSCATSGPSLYDERPPLSQTLGALSLCVRNPNTLLERSHEEALGTQRG